MHQEQSFPVLAHGHPVQDRSRARYRVVDIGFIGVVCACVSGLYAAALTDVFGETRHGPVSGMVPVMAAPSVPSAPIARMLGLIPDPARQQIERHTLPSPGVVALVPSQRLNARAADRLYDRLSYGLDIVRAEGAPVPRVYLASLPGDLKQMGSHDARKDLFLRTMLPVVLKVNEEILQDRDRLLAISRTMRDGHAPSPTDQRWLQVKAREYGLEKPNLRQLLYRVDAVPPSLVLAQAAEESGWGTSQVARRHNALFGHTAREDDPSAITATYREDGRTVRLKSFPTISDAVRSYVVNLNTHRAYNDFRVARAQMRKKSDVLDGVVLAGGLRAYSERGQAYVETLQSLIRSNELSAFDAARLSDKPLQVASLPGDLEDGIR